MSVQIFKNQIPIQFLFDLLDKICIKITNYYIINTISFRKGTYHTHIHDFIELCRPYYHVSKQKTYLDKPLTYNSFITIIRQICKNNNIQYKNEIKYNKSSYDIFYYVYIPNISTEDINAPIEDINDCNNIKDN